jgi:F-type H+-transporting ATPase subunit delta
MSFRGASAEAMAALTGELAPATSGDELFAVASVLRSEPALRRVATDVSVAPEAKSGLVEQVFGGKIRGETLGLVASAVKRRWTASRDLADALEQLGVIAVVRSASDQSGRLSDELFALGQLVKDNPELRDALSDPARSAEDKRGLLHNLLDGKAHSATIQLAGQALNGTHRTVGVALAEYQKVAAEVHNQGVATVRVARPISDGDRQRLTDALGRQYGRAVHVNVVVDPEVIGGLRVEIGDDVIDGTVSSRLDDARRKLAG